MAYIEPNTELRLLHDVPLDPDYENTLYFDNIQQQTEYFLAKTVHTFPKQSYTRKSRGWVRLGWNADQWPNNTIIQKLYDSTYMMFKNTNYENKWFYAFVDQVEYVNNNTVDVKFHIDVMQSWHFDYVFNQCLIERQHVSDDSIGANTIHEDLETGPYLNEPVEYLWNNTQFNNSGQYEYTPAVCIAASFDYEDYGLVHLVNVRKINGMKIDGVKENAAFYTGAYYYIWELTNANVSEINEFLDVVTRAGAVDGIISIFMVPLEFTTILDTTAPIPVQDLTFFFPSKIDGYEPRNNKVYHYPYTFFYVSNNQGNSAEYMLEYFKGTVKMRLFGNMSPNAGMICWPVDYKGCDGGNFDEALTVTGFPMCTWSYDSFKAWLSQNAGTIAAAALGLGMGWASLVTPMSSIIGNGITAPMLGAAGGTNMIGSVANTREIVNAQGAYISYPSRGLLASTLGAIGQVIDHARRPPQAKGNANIDLNYQTGLMTFNFYYKHIKAEYARIIDSFFDMYGYKVNRVGVPNRSVRRCYTYVKTIGCSLHGNFPSDDLMAIQKIFNNGIRFWKSTAVFGNYDPSVNNNRL